MVAQSSLFSMGRGCAASLAASQHHHLQSNPAHPCANVQRRPYGHSPVFMKRSHRRVLCALAWLFWPGAPAICPLGVMIRGPPLGPGPMPPPRGAPPGVRRSPSPCAYLHCSAGRGHWPSRHLCAVKAYISGGAWMSISRAQRSNQFRKPAANSKTTSPVNAVDLTHLWQRRVLKNTPGPLSGGGPPMPPDGPGPMGGAISLGCIIGIAIPMLGIPCIPCANGGGVSLGRHMHPARSKEANLVAGQHYRVRQLRFAHRNHTSARWHPYREHGWVHLLQALRHSVKHHRVEVWH